MRPREESNPYRALRTGLFYPSSYSSILLILLFLPLRQVADEATIHCLAEPDPASQETTRALSLSGFTKKLEPNFKAVRSPRSARFCQRGAPTRLASVIFCARFCSANAELKTNCLLAICPAFQVRAYCSNFRDSKLHPDYCCGTGHYIY